MISESPCIINYCVAVEVAAALQSDIAGRRTAARTGRPDRSYIIVVTIRTAVSHRRSQGQLNSQSRYRRYADHSFADILTCNSVVILLFACYSATTTI